MLGLFQKSFWSEPCVVFQIPWVHHLLRVPCSLLLGCTSGRISTSMTEDTGLKSWGILMCGFFLCLSGCNTLFKTFFFISASEPKALSSISFFCINILSSKLAAKSSLWFFSSLFISRILHGCLHSPRKHQHWVFCEHTIVIHTLLILQVLTFSMKTKESQLQTRSSPPW